MTRYWVDGFLGNGMMDITWLGTAGFRIEIGATTLLLDPFLSRATAARPPSPLSLADVVDADTIFCSHGHFDHVADVAEIAAASGARVYAPSAVAQLLRRDGVLDSQLRPLSGVETLGLRDMRVRTIPSAHVRPDGPLLWATLRRAWWRLLLDVATHWRYPSAQTMGFAFTAPACSWCFFGSAGFRIQEVEGLNPDIAMLPAQGKSDVFDLLVDAVVAMQPRWLIPHHFDDFYPPVSQMIELDDLLAAIQERAPATRVMVPILGQTMRYQQGELGLIVSDPPTGFPS